MNKYLKITRKRSFYRYLNDIDTLFFNQGNDIVVINSLRWNRLQLCIDSIKLHLLDVFGTSLEV